MIRLNAATAIASALLLGGCQTMQPLVSAKGPDAGAVARAIDFQAAETTARAAPTDNALARAMLLRGYELIRSNCDDYFRSAGENQTNVNFLRDATVATATIATSAMLYNPRNQTIVGVIPLVSGGVFTGMDVYNKNFLFSAENIDAVKVLVMKAVSTHQQASLQSINGVALTHGEALIMLQDNQAYCMPSKIVPLVRTAIKTGEVGVVQASAPVVADPRSAAQVAADAAVLKALGTELNPPSSVSSQQATALYWLFVGDATVAERAEIFKQLQGLPAGSQPVDAAGVFTAGWSHQGAVEAALKSFSPGAVAAMEAAIQAVRRDMAEINAARTLERAAAFGQLAADEQSKAAARAASTPRSLSAPVAVSPTTARVPVVVDVR